MSYEQYEQWKTVPLAQEPILSVVIPAYNEEVRIIPTIGAIASHVCSLEIPWELIISDDGSRDSTVQLVEELELPNVRVLRAPQNGGKGSAVRRGMLAARGQMLLFADADNSTPIEELPRLIEMINKQGYDIAVGSRAVQGAEEASRPLVRRIMSGGLRWIVRLFFRIGVRDTQCGFKLFTREAAQRLYTVQTIMGFSFDLEILYLAAKFGYRIAEVPVSWIDAPGSKVNKAQEIKRFLRDLIKIKLNDLRGLYSHTQPEIVREPKTLWR